LRNEPKPGTEELSQRAVGEELADHSLLILLHVGRRTNPTRRAISFEPNGDAVPSGLADPRLRADAHVAPNEPTLGQSRQHRTRPASERRYAHVASVSSGGERLSIIRSDTEYSLNKYNGFKNLYSRYRGARASHPLEPSIRFTPRSRVGDSTMWWRPGGWPCLCPRPSIGLRLFRRKEKPCSDEKRCRRFWRRPRV